MIIAAVTGALFDVGLSAASAALEPADGQGGGAGGGATGGGEGHGAEAGRGGVGSGAVEAQVRLRERRRAEDLREQLALFVPELTILGLSVEDAAAMDDKGLRLVYRARSRSLHPDLNPGLRTSASGSAELEGEEMQSAPTIYDINQAYESIKKILC